jgi:lysophospholipase L1-like esterase
VVLWQYYKVRTDYKRLPTPAGPNFGLEAPFENFEPACTPTHTPSSPSRADAKECGEKRAERHAQSGESDASEVVLFIGDSLVMGIGCPDDARGPVFSRQITQSLATVRGRQVGWGSFGVNGGDLKRMKAELLDDVKRYDDSIQQHYDSVKKTRVSTVVIMCGLNDYKNLILEGRLPSHFRRDLEELITKVREIVGEEAKIVIPGIPVNHAPLFQKMFPFNLALYEIAKEWDRQKQLIADEDELIVFVDEPPHFTPADWARDGVHPSAQGYQEWGNHVAFRTWGVEAPGYRGTKLRSIETKV